MSKKRAKRQESKLGGLHVTVIALGMDGLSLSRETEMAKAALLYADKVTIASPNAALLAAMASLTVGDKRQRMQTLSQLASVLPDGEAIPQVVEHLLAQKHPSREELLMLRQLESSVAQLEAVIETQLAEAGAGELSLAIASGLVDIDLLGLDEVREVRDFDVVIERVVSLIETTVSRSSNSHPLFDGSSGDLLGAMLNEGKIKDAALGSARKISIASTLIASLEAFPNASMDVILDVRERLGDALIRFRVAVDDLSRETREVPSGPAFEAEVRRLYRVKVEPRMLEIRELLSELRAVPTLARVASAGVLPGALAFVVGAGLGAADWVKLASIGGTASAAAAKEYLKRRDVQSSARRNEFYFLYAADVAMARA